MSPPELHPEIWTHIVSYLHRPKPSLKTDAWSCLHQQDLANMMRVSKMLCIVTAPILYREPIVENVHSFLYCGQVDGIPSKEALDHLLGYMALNKRHGIYLKEAQYVLGQRGIALQPKSFIRLSYIHKSYFYKYTQRVHIIHTTNSYTINYSMIFLITSSKTRASLWIYLTDKSSLKGRNAMDQLRPESAIEVIELYEEEIYRLFKNSAKSTSHNTLRPKSISFGAYGDISWNARQYNLMRRQASGMLWGNATEQEHSKMMQQRQRSSVMQTSIYIGSLWNSFGPQTLCNRFYGGPLGVANQPIIPWHSPQDGGEVVNTQKSRVIHTDLMEKPMSFTLGSTNIIIYHPIEAGFSQIFRDSIESSLIRELNQVQKAAELALGMGTIREDVVAGTRIDLYWGFLAGLEKKDSKRRIREVQQALDKALWLLKGKVKVHAYQDAPSCSACGWRIEDDFVEDLD